MCVSAFAPTPHALITPIAAIVARFVARRPRAHRPRLASPSSFFFPVASPARRAIVLSFRARVRVASLAVRSLARSSVAVCRRAAAPSPPGISGVSRDGARHLAINPSFGHSSCGSRASQCVPSIARFDWLARDRARRFRSTSDDIGHSDTRS
jgi:hypothetical protein